jgi:hypothetical protein
MSIIGVGVRGSLRAWVGCWLAAAVLAFGGGARADLGYLLSPDLHGDRIVFSAEGDLWTAATDGRGVGRLTSHPGTEFQPRFSPDGRWIAFNGYYDGNTDVRSGHEGEPAAHLASADDILVGWTPDGREVIFMTGATIPPQPALRHCGRRRRSWLPLGRQLHRRRSERPWGRAHLGGGT